MITFSENWLPFLVLLGLWGILTLWVDKLLPTSKKLPAVLTTKKEFGTKLVLFFVTVITIYGILWVLVNYNYYE